MPETRYAILIGNSDYPADPKLGNLRLPAQDVAGLADVLLTPNSGQFPKTNVQTLINQPHRVTKVSWKYFINWLCMAPV